MDRVVIARGSISTSLEASPLGREAPVVLPEPNDGYNSIPGPMTNAFDYANQFGVHPCPVCFCWPP